MVAEPWIHAMRRRNKDHLRPLLSSEPATIGILSFEVAATMSRAVHLHHTLSNAELASLRSQALAAPAVRTLVSQHEPRLLTLAAAERLYELNSVAAVAARLGRCFLASPVLLAFDLVYSDLLAGRRGRRLASRCTANHPRRQTSLVAWPLAAL